MLSGPQEPARPSSSAPLTSTTSASGAYSLSAAAGEQAASIDGEAVGVLTLKDRTYRGDFYVRSNGCVARYGIVVDQQTQRPVAGATVSVGAASARTY